MSTDKKLITISSKIAEEIIRGATMALAYPSYVEITIVERRAFVEALLWGGDEYSIKIYGVVSSRKVSLYGVHRGGKNNLVATRLKELGDKTIREQIAFYIGNYIQSAPNDRYDKIDGQKLISIVRESSKSCELSVKKLNDAFGARLFSKIKSLDNKKCSGFTLSVLGETTMRITTRDGGKWSVSSGVTIFENSGKGDPKRGKYEDLDEIAQISLVIRGGKPKSVNVVSISADSDSIDANFELGTLGKSDGNKLGKWKALKKTLEKAGGIISSLEDLIIMDIACRRV